MTTTINPTSMTFHQRLTTLLGDAEFTATVSQAEFLDLPTGVYGEDGWPILQTIKAGDRMVSRQNHLYKVLGFTVDNTVICRETGLHRFFPEIRFFEFEAEGLRHADGEVAPWQ